MRHSVCAILGLSACTLLWFWQRGEARAYFIGTSLPKQGSPARRDTVKDGQGKPKIAAGAGAGDATSQIGSTFGVAVMASMVMFGATSALKQAESKGWQRPLYKPPPVVLPEPSPDRETLKANALKELMAAGTRKLGGYIEGEDPRFLNAVAKAGVSDANPPPFERELPKNGPTVPFTSPLGEKLNGYSGLIPGRYSGAPRPLNSLL